MSHRKFLVANDLELISDILLDPESSSFLILYQKYCPVFYTAIGAFHFHYYDLDDLKVEAMLICYQSALDFKPERHNTFGSFYKANLTNYFMTLLRNQAAKKRKVDYLINSLDSLIEENGTAYLGPDKSEIAADVHLQIQERLAKLPLMLSSLEWQVMESFCNSNPISRRIIARRLGISYTRFYNAANRCKKKLRRLLFEDCPELGDIDE